ncbi:MAG: DUF2845 domain-containing protein [Gammaproteobacteria bacterium]|nr:DUF2845 domain-containing protein [Gammaproteobacteria bacterium]
MIIGKYLLGSAALLALLFAEPAAALRCGNKLVKEGMHEQQVIAICGEPTSMRHIGYALRSYDLRLRRRAAPGLTEYYFPGYAHLAQEVMITEYVYNFGPRKKMRRLLFEGGILVTVESIGYGYHE